MPISELLLPEFDQEMANTRKTLERVPADKWDWKPHSKSGSLGWMASPHCHSPKFHRHDHPVLRIRNRRQHTHQSRRRLASFADL